VLELVDVLASVEGLDSIEELDVVSAASEVVEVDEVWAREVVFASEVVCASEVLVSVVEVDAASEVLTIVASAPSVLVGATLKTEVNLLPLACASFTACTSCVSASLGTVDKNPIRGGSSEGCVRLPK